MMRAVLSLSVVALIAALVLATPGLRAPAHMNLSTAASTHDDSNIFPIYSDDPSDPWNLIFHSLFTRTFRVRVSDAYPEGNPPPYGDFGDFMKVQIGASILVRTESGDRPIDPLYSPPADSPDGSRQLLTDPRYSMLLAALQEALNDSTPRNPLARALMQNDLWSAYDLLHWNLFPRDRGTFLELHKQQISDLLARLIRKLALTPQEIDSLPDNYAAARASRDSLPDLFGSNSDWMEIRWFLPRLHDGQAGYRRVSRVFVKPSRLLQNKQSFLDSLRTSNGMANLQLDGAVILIQPLLIDTHGRMTPSHLTTDVEVRLFRRSSTGEFQKTDVHTYELSRRLMLHDPATGGLDSLDENSPVFLSAGGSYGFAEPTLFRSPSDAGPHFPVVVNLRSRCAHCHGADLDVLMTFSIKVPPHSPPPHVKQLNRASHQVALFDIPLKSKRPEWRALHAYFESTSGAQN